MIRSFISLCLSSCLWPAMLSAAEIATNTPDSRTGDGVQPLVRAHAHNDYSHDRPLLDALSKGFCSVEADVFVADGFLLVGHSRSELKATRTLRALYLDPLLERVRKNGGRVYPGGPTFMLLVDIKSNGEQAYAVLDDALVGYEDMLTRVTDGIIEERAVSIVVSGDRAWKRIETDPSRFVGVDGRLTDLSSDRPSHLMPLISDNWAKVSQWSGVGPMPDAERVKLRQIVDAAHAAGWRIRFWATPDHPSPERNAVWAELIAAGVDHIGTDDLDGLRSFLLSASTSGP